jgi:hypothetical protein
MPEPGAAAAARNSAVIEDHVAQLGAGSDRAAVGPAVEDQPAADPGSERQQHHVRRPPACSKPPLGNRGAVRVVVDRNR